MKIDSEITLTITMSGREALNILDFINLNMGDNPGKSVKEFARQLDLVRKV